MKFLPYGKATCIGSLPHKSAEDALRVIDKYLLDIPIWPQLPNVDFHENMYIQYSEGMPGAIIDNKNEKIYFDTSNNLINSIEKTYEAYLSQNLEHFKISENFSNGLYSFVNFYKGKKLITVKGHVLGPISFGLTVTDQDKKSIFYNEELRDAVVKSLVMKTKWQIQFLKSISDNIIIFIDEPYLASFGSAYINLSKEQVIEYLNEIIDAIHEEGAISGIHCCGNTDWSILMDTKIDILNFDAYGFAKNILIYPDKIKQFFSRGGVLAWGIVPTSDEIENTTPESLLATLEKYFDELISKGIVKEELIKRTMITPSCGTGSMEVKKAEKVFETTNNLSKLFINKYASFIKEPSVI